jgi:hypothetical protein
MPRKIANLNKGVYVMITPANSRAVGRIIARTGRSFSREINTMISDLVRQNGDENERNKTAAEEPAHAAA